MSSATISAVTCVVGASFGVMLIGFFAVRSDWLAEPVRKGLARMYVQLVFPTVVFKGVAAIDMGSVDTSVALIVLYSKLVLAALVVGVGFMTMRATHGRTALAHAAAMAMAASHSFDVTRARRPRSPAFDPARWQRHAWPVHCAAPRAPLPFHVRPPPTTPCAAAAVGVPLAKELFPASVPYVYLNQSVQLVAVNPVLLVLIELGSGGAAADAAARRPSTAAVLLRALRGTASNPLVSFTAAGLLASRLYPSGLPPMLAALTAQIGGAGGFLGFLCLGFALGSVGSMRADDGLHAAAPPSTRSRSRATCRRWSSALSCPSHSSQASHSRSLRCRRPRSPGKWRAAYGRSSASSRPWRSRSCCFAAARAKRPSEPLRMFRSKCENTLGIRLLCATGSHPRWHVHRTASAAAARSRFCSSP
jgi:predicted permease